MPLDGIQQEVMKYINEDLDSPQNTRDIDLDETEILSVVV